MIYIVYQTSCIIVYRMCWFNVYRNLAWLSVATRVLVLIQSNKLVIIKKMKAFVVKYIDCIQCNILLSSMQSIDRKLYHIGEIYCCNILWVSSCTCIIKYLRHYLIHSVQHTYTEAQNHGMHLRQNAALIDIG